MNRPQLIVMLTHHDHTVPNAAEIYDACKDAKAQFWGFKEIGLPVSEMKDLFAAMKQQGKTTCLEVVAYTEPECLHGAQLAVECGCDILMGTRFFDSINEYCRQNGLKYMPFVGTLSQRPTILEGSLEQMLEEANLYLSKGVYGLDLLGYRYTGDAEELIRQFVANVNAPICVAGSINSYDRIEVVKQTGAWAFTIGGAFFENRFGSDFATQIDRVCRYLEEPVFTAVG